MFPLSLEGTAYAFYLFAYAFHVRAGRRFRSPIWAPESLHTQLTPTLRYSGKALTRALTLPDAAEIVNVLYIMIPSQGLKKTRHIYFFIKREI